MQHLSRRDFIKTGTLASLAAATVDLQSTSTNHAAEAVPPANKANLIIARRQGRGTKPIDPIFPNLDGYITLKADLHQHTVFSDGDLWPTARIDEAKREGLDVVCLSDHIEVRPNKNELTTNDLGRGYQLATARAKAEKILLIPGLEITRAEPHAKHLNALFLEDFNILVQEKLKDAVYAAANQNAFIFWNHPAWGQAKQEAVWYPEMQEFLDKGILKGFEVVNGFEGDQRDYQPDVMSWCQKHQVTMLGNSDLHKASPYFYDWAVGHRPMTLIFAKERTLDSVKEALVAGRTAIYYYDYGKRDTIIGNVSWVRALFEKAFQYKAETTGLETSTLTFQNAFAFPLELKRRDSDGIIFPETLIIPSGKSSMNFARKGNSFWGTFDVLNCDVAKGQKLMIQIR